MKYAIALDIGGTSIKYTLVNQNGDILYESSETTQSKENPRPLSDIIKSIVRKMTDYAVPGLGDLRNWHRCTFRSR